MVQKFAVADVEAEALDHLIVDDFAVLVKVSLPDEKLTEPQSLLFGPPNKCHHDELVEVAQDQWLLVGFDIQCPCFFLVTGRE